MKARKKDTDPPKFPPMRQPPTFTKTDVEAAKRYEVERRLKANSGIRPAYPELMFSGGMGAASAAAKPAFNLTKNIAKPSMFKKIAGMLLPFSDEAVVAGSQLFDDDNNNYIYKKGGKITKQTKK